MGENLIKNRKHNKKEIECIEDLARQWTAKGTADARKENI